MDIMVIMFAIGGIIIPAIGIGFQCMIVCDTTPARVVGFILGALSWVGFFAIPTIATAIAPETGVMTWVTLGGAVVATVGLVAIAGVLPDHIDKRVANKR